MIINRASRILKNAKVNELLISETAYYGSDYNTVNAE
jgi:hypothetical protein